VAAGQPAATGAIAARVANAARICARAGEKFWPTCGFLAWRAGFQGEQDNKLCTPWRRAQHATVRLMANTMAPFSVWQG